MTDRDIQKVCKLASKDQHEMLFRPSKSVCTVCHKPLEVYYAESGVYAVRCPLCEIITILGANNPITAAAWVGVEKPFLRKTTDRKEAEPNE